MKKEMKRNIFAIVSVLIISIAIIMVSKSIFPDGFIEDRYGKGAEFYNGVITALIFNSFMILISLSISSSVTTYPP